MMRSLLRSPEHFALLCIFALVITATSAGQTPEYLPDAPNAGNSVSASASSLDLDQQPSGGPQHDPVPASHEDPQQKRIFGIIPNFKSVTAGTKLPPQTVKDKFITASQDSFDYSSLTLALVVTAEAYGTSSTPEFGTGAVSFGRYFWHTYVDEISENYFVEFIIPTITHEDTRYYSLGHGGFAKRATYSLSRAFITKTNSGKTTFNSSEIIGAGAAAGVSSLYYPRAERSLDNTINQWGTSIGIDVASFFFREFYPDIYHGIFHKKVDPSVPPGN